MIHGLTAKAVGELALSDAADQQPDKGRAPHHGDLRRGDESALDHVGHQRPEDRQVEDIEKIAGGDERQNPPVDRRHPRIVHRSADERLDRLGHMLHSSLSASFSGCGAADRYRLG